MTKLRALHLQMVRDNMRMFLRVNEALDKRALWRRLQNINFFKTNFRNDALYALVCEAVRIYDEDFYVDPPTKRVSLTNRARRWEDERLAQKRSGRAPDTTHAAMVADAMEG